MKVLSSEAICVVFGGDAAATRQEGQNSYGEWPSNPSAGVNMANCVAGMTQYGPNWDCLIAAAEAARAMAEAGAAKGNNTQMPGVDPMGNQTGYDFMAMA